MKKISFNLITGRNVNEVMPPEPGSAFIPQWYRDGEKFINVQDHSLNIPSEDLRSPGMKSCVPFLDALISGYIQPLSYDIEILKNDDAGPVEYRYVQKNDKGEYEEIPNMNLIDERHGFIGHTIPRPTGFSHNHMTWRGNWGWEVPKGWSVLVTHPLNRFDLPFMITSGIMESDRFTAPGNVPFFIRKDFVGIIEKGTPLFQIIPIKRAKWIGYVKRKVNDQKSEFVAMRARDAKIGYYRDKLWEKKVYEMEK